MTDYPPRGYDGTDPSPAVLAAPGPPPPATDEAACEIVALVFEGTDETLAAARELAGTLTLTQLRAVETAFEDAQAVAARARNRRLADAMREG